jgi:tRNA pseudouridine38-40 synthase
MLLPHIYIKKLELVDDSFHARFSAKKRYYRYILYKGSYNPFFAKYALHVKSIDTQKLDKIIKHFIGSHNFEYFRKNGSENKSDVREIFDAGAYDHQNFTVVYFYGNSFLRSQVRMMCDFSLQVMQGKYNIKELQEQLERKQKHATSLSPASGLYLSKIYY